MLFCVTCFNTFGQQVKKISVQGFLKDGTGKAVTDGPMVITFKLYTTETGGTAAWTDAQTVKVTGGVYSVYLGTATNPIDALNWGTSTFFVGVTVGTDELTPRTELTFAPYSLGAPFADRARLADLATKATTVVCSGALGDVKYSILNPQQFATVNGNCWVPMDGGNMSGSKLAAIIGGSTVPNAGGLFLRGQESQSGSDNDPDRNSNSTIASFQDQAMQTHTHPFTGTTSYDQANTAAPFITYTYGYFTGNFGNIPTDALTRSFEEGRGDPDVYPRMSTADLRGFHGHSVSGTTSNYSNATVNETRPKNLNLWTYIRIN